MSRSILLAMVILIACSPETKFQKEPPRLALSPSPEPTPAPSPEQSACEREVEQLRDEIKTLRDRLSEPQECQCYYYDDSDY